MRFIEDERSKVFYVLQKIKEEQKHQKLQYFRRGRSKWQSVGKPLQARQSLAMCVSEARGNARFTRPATFIPIIRK